MFRTTHAFAKRAPTWTAGRASAGGPISGLPALKPRRSSDVSNRSEVAVDTTTNGHTNNNDTTLIQLVTFKIADEEFGVDILRVQEIIRMMPITKVPKAPFFVEGVINLRGKVIPIIDMRRRFGMATNAHDGQTRITVMDLQGQVVGFVVDAVREVLRIKESTVEAPPQVVAGIGSDYLKGVGKLDDRLLILLDLDKLLSEAEMGALSGVDDAAMERAG